MTAPYLCIYRLHGREMYRSYVERHEIPAATIDTCLTAESLPPSAENGNKKLRKCDPVLAQMMLIIDQKRCCSQQCMMLTFGSNLAGTGLWGQPVACRGCSHRRSPLHAGPRRIWRGFETLYDPCTQQLSVGGVSGVRSPERWRHCEGWKTPKTF